MMHVLKIGRVYINFDLVRYVAEDDAQGLRLFFSEENREETMLKIGGEEAIAMKEWLRLNSTEVKPPLEKSWRRTTQEA